MEGHAPKFSIKGELASPYMKVFRGSVVGKLKRGRAHTFAGLAQSWETSTVSLYYSLQISIDENCFFLQNVFPDESYTPINYEMSV